MFELLTKPPAPTPAEIEHRRYISALKRRMEKLLREQGISRAKATMIVSRTFSEAFKDE